MVKKSIEVAYKQHIHNIKNQFFIDPKSFWPLIRKKRGSLPNNNIVKDGVCLTDDESARVYLDKPRPLPIWP
ncbi:unnamed protein product [Leptosia nina]|uniref:Uncharacterized protein n=1 Tax=Leptosia nina TaxID=320188 RepID=A0AAV1J2N2_9NEOP